MISLLASGPLPPSIFTPLWHKVKDTGFGKWMGFDTVKDNLGQIWFEGLCFAALVCVILVLLAFLSTRSLKRVPRGLQTLFEMAVSGIRNMVRSMAGPEGDRYVPFIGTAFLMIFVMNLMGIFPLGRSATMALSITAGMGVTAFIMTVIYVIRDAGFGAVMKHLAGPVWWLAPLIFVAELLSMFIRPVSLSMRLYGNIYGEDNVIEAFIGLGEKYYIPFQFPILGLALLTAFLQAYIFTMLCTYYIASMTVHEEGHGEEHGKGDDHGHGHGHEPAAAHAKH
jgi:F-type H+-transporting ATPase subunit a